MKPTYVRFTDTYGNPLYVVSDAIYCIHEDLDGTALKLWGIDGNADVMFVRDSADTVAAKLNGLEE